MRAPFLPLVGDAEGLDLPADDARLRARMAEIYGVTATSVLPVQGALQAVDLLMRRAARDGATQFTAADTPALRQLAKINGLTLDSAVNTGSGGDLIASPDAKEGRALTTAEVLRRAAAIAPALVILDETLIEFEDAPSAVSLIGDADNLAVIRSLEVGYGLTGAPCAAIIAAPPLIARLEDVRLPGALATPIVRLALAALAPARVAANTARIAEIRAERARLAAALPNAQAGGGPYVLLRPEDAEAARAAIRRFQIEGTWCDGATFLLAMGAPDANDRALAAFGATTGPTRRRAEVVRETKETQIVVRVDLDREGPCDVQTGVGFFDHMLSQIALHGGFTLTLACAGDLEVDAHHTIEDCALALGQAMKQALGARKGICRFGFLLPMDEAEAQVSIDLSGRPYLVFDGAFDASHIGAYPTEMTEHVFRSLAQSMGAAIHIRVSGENDHHKTEACFKSFGRALRQALRVEGEAMPSTKGVL